MMAAGRKAQKGATFFSIMIGLIIAGIFFSVGFKLYTPYAEYLTVESILENMSTDQEDLKKNVKQLKADFGKRLKVNQVKLPRDALEITRKAGVIKFDLDYEVRVPMFKNVDAVVVFKKEYEAIAP